MKPFGKIGGLGNAEANQAEAAGDESEQRVDEMLQQSKMRQRFLDANNIDDLDMKQHAYISQQILSDTITAILLPLVKQQGQDSKSLYELNKAQKDLRNSLGTHD